MANALIEWMVKREQLRKNKEAGIRPWTDDPILREYRFTNVRRRDDRVSRWIIKHVIPFQEHPQFLPFLALCRWVNWPPTIKEILDQRLFGGGYPKWDRMVKLIDNKTKRGEKAWTGAYMVRATDDGRSKADYVVNDVCVLGVEPLIHAIVDYCVDHHGRREIWALLAERRFWGSFMAGQFVDDLTWTIYLNAPYDDYTWAPQGPGSRRGYNRLLGVPVKNHITERDWTYWLVRWHGEATAANREFADLTLMDLQNCLCEYDKYERVRLGEGRPRSTYKPETAYRV